MIRSFIFPTKTGTLSVTESSTPDSVLITIDSGGVLLSKEQFQELASLASYSSYGDSIKWAEPPTQPDLIPDEEFDPKN
ncbi:hypothetical protein THIOSC15_2100006 [uncultured Thiomicrorhabdus sp.]